MNTGPLPDRRRLPDGFAVELDHRVHRLDGGATLLGGAPVRLLRLSARAAELLAPGRRLVVRDAITAALARRLLDTGVAHPRPRPGRRDAGAVTVVIPVRDRPAGLDRLLGGLAGLAVTVVDDGSVDAIAVRRICARHGAALTRHEHAHGPAAARNAGLAAVITPYAALIDSDCLPVPGWLEPLLGHLDDPLVALVAPRIVALPTRARPGWLAAYETACSSLDRGPREGLVAPRTAVPYVPSAAVLVRRGALGGGYDEGMHVAEDVDLVWRLAAAGWSVRYEPRARVAHEHRIRPVDWARRRAYYGTGAAPLAQRHGAAVAPLVLSPWSAAAWALALTGTRTGAAGAVAVLGAATARVALLVRAPDRLGGAPSGGDLQVAARLVVLGTLGAGRQLVSAATRHHWPVALGLALSSRRFRRAVVVSSVLADLAAWRTYRPALDPARFLLARRIDDLAYGGGLWWGAWRSRTAAPLRPAGPGDARRPVR